MSIEYKAVLCYGIELTHEKELAYIEKVGEERWEEIYEEFFIMADGWSGTESYGILGIELTSAADGEYIGLGDGHLIRSISSVQYDRFKEVMFEVEEFEPRLQWWMICQVS